MIENDKAPSLGESDDLLSRAKELLVELGAGTDSKVDLIDLIDKLMRPPTSTKLRHYLTWEYRFVELLRERSRRAARDTYDFIDQNMRHALYNENQFAVLHSKRDVIGESGTEILDLGVYKGGSTRALSKSFPSHSIHGFDSFEGLPEDWSHAMKGQFGELKGSLPEMPKNVTLYKGWFDETLPVWAKNHVDKKIALLRVDCDIYSSTKTIFDCIGHYLEPGSWICFDELIGYYGWQDHEYKAFSEFLDKRRMKCDYIAYGLTYTIVRLK
ncbi:MAG: methyltransferase [Rhodobacterales bacterium CG15_BIG_FIL_POST_REV_8_21_14_020_59_13]|nr:MAG: methyltransferase [Rhodobacterales bacterium CG15_BIG_FIL_POST_REV_8_21_14_020_59_13]